MKLDMHNDFDVEENIQYWNNWTNE